VSVKVEHRGCGGAQELSRSGVGSAKEGPVASTQGGVERLITARRSPCDSLMRFTS
jgi:hypothetical protein